MPTNAPLVDPKGEMLLKLYEGGDSILESISPETE